MSDAKKRKKAYYVQASKAKKQRSLYRLDAGFRGFLITCNNAEKKAVQEAYSILNEYADMMYGCEQGCQDEESSQGEEDFELAIREEVEALKKNDVSARRFQVVETKTNNCIFIKTTLEHPDELVSKVFSDLCESHKSKSRFILKLFPVLGTCRAVEEKIEKLVEEVLSPFLKDSEGLTFCVIYKVRCNNTLGRDAIIKLVAQVASQINPSIKVKFDDPDLVISVDVLQKICCVSVLRNFNKFRKYNVQEVVNPTRTALVTPSANAPVVGKVDSPSPGQSELDGLEPLLISEATEEAKEERDDAKTAQPLDLSMDLKTSSLVSGCDILSAPGEQLETEVGLNLNKAS